MGIKGNLYTSSSPCDSTTSDLDYGNQIRVLKTIRNMTFGDCGEIMREEYLKELYGTDLRIIPVKELDRNICAVPKLNMVAIEQNR